MEEKSRTEYSVRNTTAAMISRILAILMGFLTRVVFTHTLSESYVGVNGLFGDILSVLSLSELGIGTAITYALYQPIAEKDIEKQKTLMRLYRRLYLAVAGIVTAAGLAVVPFMDVLIKNKPDIDNLTLIYLIYLANSVLSYLLIYKKTLLDAHQLSYIGVVCQTGFWMLQDILQMVLLVVTHNFILYLLVSMVCTVGCNLCISRKADRMYPYLKEREVRALPREERGQILRNIRAMMMHKAGTVVLNNTDNLILSAVVGISSVGCYSNYYLVIGSIRQVLDQSFQGITASVGNLGATQHENRIKEIFESAFFAGQWMYGFAAVCLFELLTPFVEISFGRQYIFGQAVVFILCLNFYVRGMRQAALIFRDSLGLFWFDRYKAVVEAVLNLVISIVLAGKYGTAGVFAGTFISTILTSVWIEPLILYRHSLKEPVRGYFMRYAVYAAVTAGGGIITHLFCSMMQGNVWTVFLMRLPICLLVPNIVMFLCFCRTKEMRFIADKIKRIIKKEKEDRSE